MNNQNVIAIEGLTFRYDGTSVLEEVNLTIGEREFVWVVGPNGGGKTTLLKLILGLLKPQKGRVAVFGRAPQQARPRVGYMPQQARLDIQFPIDAMDIVLMGRLGAGVRPGPYRGHDRAIARQALREVGLEDLRRQPFSKLSGGQQRRLLIARALASEPELLLLDEPTANLDLAVERELFELLRTLNQRLTIVMVSHDPAFVSQFVERVVCVNRRVMVHPTCDVEEGMMSELYGRQVKLVRHEQHNARGEQS
ncbi:MAG TPA: ABC transporter ATP-binding protein [Candidatus Deferrimicrobium sp.]|nr:ABC transporter ATP-binding protein [Candidatus Deferrimicrobium sp.]